MKIHRSKSFALRCICSALIVLTGAVFAAQDAPTNKNGQGFTGTPVSVNRNARSLRRQGAPGSRVWNLKDVDIHTLIKEVSDITGKNFVIAPNVDAKVTLMSKEPLSKDELYQALLAVLRAHGYIAVPEGKVIKIVPEKHSNHLSGPLSLQGGERPGSEMIVATVRIHNYPAYGLVKVLKSLMPKYSYVAAYKASNDLIIADHADNIEKVRELIKRLDQPTTAKLEVIKLQNASAVDMAKAVNDLFRRGKAAVGALKLSVVADERTNSLMIYGGTSRDRLEVRAMATRLDVTSATRRETMEVFYLKYIPAETVAPVLQGIIENYYAKQEEEDARLRRARASASRAQRPLRIPASTTSQFNLRRPTQNFPGSSFAGTGGLGSNIRQGLTFEPPRSGSLGPNIQWEESTNSIIITAPVELMMQLRGVIAKLDIRRPQVLIEVIAAEVSVNMSRELGVEWSFAGGSNFQFHQRFGTNLSTSFIDAMGQVANSGGAGLGTGLTFGYLRMGNLRALVRALQNDSRSNVLATPNLLTLDNQEAVIKVGRKVSFAIGQIDNSPTGGNPFTSLEREDVGLVLVLKPQITPDGYVKLLIQQELSSVIAGTEQARAGQNPDTSERFISTTVMAKDGQTIVLGGLIQKQMLESVSKIPILGDIPVLGKLFQNRYRTLEKTNLMIFMRPVIVDDSCKADKVTGGKYEYLRQTQMHMDRPNRHKFVSPTAPMLGKHRQLPDPFSPRVRRHG